MPPQNLRIPGPTPLPDAVREAGSRQMVAHRGPEFKELVARVSEGLQPTFRTSADVMVVTASGTGGLESAIVSFLSQGDVVLSVSIGVFGDRFPSIAKTYGADVTKPAIEWGHAADPEMVREAIRSMTSAGRSPKAVLLTFNETSTGVTNPLQQLAAVVHDEAPQALLIVDAISGLGAMPFEMDAWGLDVVVTGSQKSWMVPPGLAMAAVSERGWAAAEQASMPRFYFDLVRHRDALLKRQTPWTPAVGLFFQLEASLVLIEAEGLEGIFARHAACGATARAGIKAMGLRPFADPAYASDTVTSIRMPEGAEWSTLSKEMLSRGLVLAGGQATLSGKIFRIGHLGDVSVGDIVRAIEVIEEAAIAAAIEVNRGVGAAAARRAGEEHSPVASAVPATSAV
ncbi:MAG: alanine--glyoxylate aminotransferase family protein [Chloroflexota bacterium]